MSQFSPGHALLIGVGADLPNTVTDATGLAASLQDPERCAYPPDQIQVLTGECATRDHILAALDKLASQSNPEATVLFIFPATDTRSALSLARPISCCPTATPSTTCPPPPSAVQN